MSQRSSENLTLLLSRASSGDADAESELMEAAYEELRRLAGGMMRRERSDHTLQATALVNEAALRLLGGNAQIASGDRAYFFGAMATAMRRVLVDHARARNAQRRGGGDYQRQGLDYAVEAIESDAQVDLVALNDALDRLETMSERQNRIVMLRFFGGMSVPEIAEHLDVSASTVEKDWRLARAWLHRQLGDDASPGDA
ncbi:MAG: RNA polymerase subunit sigma [Planctomycetota bacterium]|nr:MAG: RNA polymerase subunit sigma [Planctomycetota bacterium]